MKFTCAMDGRRRTTPVLLAANPLHGLWPHSTPSHPYSLMPDRNGITPVGRLSALFLGDARFNPPILVVSEIALEAAIDVTETCRSRRARIVVVPADSRNGVSAVLAAILVANDDSSLIFIPATLDVVPGHDFATLFHLASITSRKTGKAMVFARRSGRKDKDFGLEAGDRHPAGFRQVTRALPANSDAAMAAAEMGLLHAIAGPVAVSAQNFLEIIRDVQPTLLQGCANALALGENRSTIIRPHPGYLSLFTGAGIAEIIASRPSSLLLHPAGETMKVVSSWLDLPADTAYAARRSRTDAQAAHHVRHADNPEKRTVSS